MTRLAHGHACIGKVSATYRVWLNMKNRCNNPSYEGYAFYGGRGIVVCQAWNSFEQFLLDMGEAPKGKILDRIDNDKGYYKDNCRWATPTVSAQNRSILFRNTPHGIKGVYYHKTRHYWTVVVIRNRQRLNLYQGHDFFEACCAKKVWEIQNAFN